ncbi:MAG TPA: hypothetical protein VGM56_24430 [Byssovorax sp.]|jgi:hypothetical protein
MENAFVDGHVRAAQGELASLESALDAAAEAAGRGEPTTDALAGATKSLHAAKASVDQIGKMLTTEAADAADVRPCPACGRSVRAAATLCGHCWTKLPS